jgi:hypothetical protein
MLKGKIRHCDVCELVIPKGERYVASVIQRQMVADFKALNASQPDMSVTYTLDDQGNAHVDICLDCKTGMDIPGNEVVN